MEFVLTGHRGQKVRSVSHDQYLCLVPECHQPSGNPVPLSPPPPLLPVSVDLPVRDVYRHRTSHAAWPFAAGSFHSAPCFGVYSHRDICQGFVPFCGRIVSRRVDGPRLVRPLHLVVRTWAALILWPLRVVLLGTRVTRTWGPAFSSFRSVARSGIAGSSGHSVLRVFEELPLTWIFKVELKMSKKCQVYGESGAVP